jgi:hypothetical protein
MRAKPDRAISPNAASMPAARTRGPKVGRKRSRPKLAVPFATGNGPPTRLLGFDHIKIEAHPHNQPTRQSPNRHPPRASENWAIAPPSDRVHADQTPGRSPRTPEKSWQIGHTCRYAPPNHGRHLTRPTVSSSPARPDRIAACHPQRHASTPMGVVTYYVLPKCPNLPWRRPITLRDNAARAF